MKPQNQLLLQTDDLVNNPTTKSFPDFSAGILGYSENIFLDLPLIT
jgi:hypothetical protein